jgi:hypothetical protein
MYKKIYNELSLVLRDRFHTLIDSWLFDDDTIRPTGTGFCSFLFWSNAPYWRHSESTVRLSNLVENMLTTELDLLDLGRDRYC